MKILLITARTDLGGGPKHLLDLIKFQTQVEYFLAAPIEAPFGLEMVNLVSHHLEIKKRSFSLIDFLRLVFYLWKNQINIVHSHGRGAGMYSRLLYFLGFKIIHTFHGVHQEKGLVGRIKYFIDRWLAPFAHHYICVSDDEFKKAQQVYFLDEVPTAIIFNGVDLGAFQFNYSSREAKVLGCMARASYQKGYDILFENLLNLKKNWPNFIFKIAGARESELAIPKELESNCQIIGVTDSHKFLSEIDIYVSASRWEGLPLAVLEAMATGVPCLLSNVVGHRYFITKNDIALGYNLLDKNNFVEQLLKLREDNDFCRKMTKNARNLMVEIHSAAKVAKQTQLIYEQV